MEGQHLGRYEVLDEIGRGGVAIVYRARDERLGTFVAVKVLAPNFTRDDQAVARFEREARAASTVDHPAIARLLDLGLDGGTRYLVFEMLTGGTLAERLHREGPLPWREAVRLSAQVARALAALHAAGVLHRDVKPGNVLVDALGNAKLADFGTARDPSSEDGLTKTGELAGTPEFASPEQHDGGSVDERCDLYGLGALLHALLVGEPPFRGNGFQLLKKVLEEPAPDVRRRAPGTPSEVAALVARLLAKVPAERGATAESVASELEALEVERAPARSPLLLALAASLVALVFMLAALVVALGRESPRHPPPAAPAPTIVARPVEASAAPVISVTATWGTRALCVKAALAGVAFVGSDAALAAGADGSLILWDLVRRERRTVLAARGPALVSLAVHDSCALTCDATGEAQLWDLVSGRQVRAWRGPARFTRVALAGDLALAADEKATVSLVQLPWSRSQSVPLEKGGQFGRIVALAATPDGSVVVVTDEAHVAVVRVNADGAHGDIWNADQPVTTVAVAPDGRSIACGHRNGAIQIVDTRGNTLVKTWQGHKAAVTSLRFTPDARRLVSASRDPNYRWPVVWDAATGARLAELRGQGGGDFGDLDISSDGLRALTANSDGSIGVFSLETATEPAMGEWVHRGAIAGIALDEEGELGVSVGFDRYIRVWDARTGKETTRLSGDGGPYQGVAFVERSRFVATTATGVLLDYDVRTRQGGFVDGIMGPPGTTSVAAVNGVLYQARGNELARFEPARSRGFRPTGLSHEVLSMAAARSLLVLGTPSGMVVFRGTDERDDLSVAPAHAGEVVACAASRDGALALTGGVEGDVVLWDLERRSETARSSYHQRVAALALAEGPERRALVATEDGLVRLVALPSGRELGRLDLALEHDAPTALAVNPKTGDVYIGTARGVVEKAAINLARP